MPSTLCRLHAATIRSAQLPASCVVPRPALLPSLALLLPAALHIPAQAQRTRHTACVTVPASSLPGTVHLAPPRRAAPRKRRCCVRAPERYTVLLGGTTHTYTHTHTHSDSVLPQSPWASLKSFKPVRRSQRLHSASHLTANAGLELYRLEQRYTRREKRSTFISEARYVDGEYVYTSSPSSSTKSAGTTSSRRFSKMPSMTAVRVKELARAGTGRS